MKKQVAKRLRIKQKATEVILILIGRKTKSEFIEPTLNFVQK